MELYIKIRNQVGETNIVANEKDSFILVNGEKRKINAGEFISKAIVITGKWKNEYINESVYDGESFYIRFEGNQEHIIVGRNEFPINYYELTDLIMEVAE